MQYNTNFLNYMNVDRHEVKCYATVKTFADYCENFPYLFRKSVFQILIICFSTVLSNALAMGRDFLHQIRLHKAPSNLTLNTPKDRACTASLGNLLHPRHKKFLPYLQTKPALFQFKNTLVLSLQALLKRAKRRGRKAGEANSSLSPAVQHHHLFCVASGNRDLGSLLSLAWVTLGSALLSQPLCTQTLLLF